MGHISWPTDYSKKQSLHGLYFITSESSLTLDWKVVGWPSSVSVSLGREGRLTSAPALIFKCTCSLRPARQGDQRPALTFKCTCSVRPARQVDQRPTLTFKCTCSLRPARQGDQRPALTFKCTCSVRPARQVDQRPSLDLQVLCPCLKPGLVLTTFNKGFSTMFYLFNHPDLVI